MKAQWIDQEFEYDGTQLSSLFAYMGHGVLGDSIVAWIGPCSIAFEHMVDGEDVLAGATIAGRRMLHFIIEKFHTPLETAVVLQRLFASICHDLIREEWMLKKSSSGDFEGKMASLEEASGHGPSLFRDGDDLFFGSGKLSISIATVSPVSSMIHFAINVTNEGTPVKTASLEDLGLDAQQFAEMAMQKWVQEVTSIQEATCKVRWVK